ncbi:UNVERIFIED_CONTAM: hypothetical protein O8I53_05250 [Campylobacter lari]
MSEIKSGRPVIAFGYFYNKPPRITDSLDKDYGKRKAHAILIYGHTKDNYYIAHYG